MKLIIGFVCFITMIFVDGAPQAGPIFGLPLEYYSPHCRPPPCPSSGNVMVRYPLDCLQYVECNNGVAAVKACPPDLLWHEAAGNCAEREIANCKQCW